MNKDLKTFLLGHHAFPEDAWQANLVDPVAIGDKAIYALDQFGVLSVSGKDAVTLLQGQITCNVNDVNESKAIFGAICNPKGRVIATFLLAKKSDEFLLILPLALLETVRLRLQMYILRSQVNIVDCSDEFCLLGFSEPSLPSANFHAEVKGSTISVNFPASFKRSLLLSDAENAIRLWSENVDIQGFRLAYAHEWAYLDIITGIPWLNEATSEEFIPQMLNLDKLGGISFNKGCYTGQEIVARTHYLGKNKREMFLAECQCSMPPEPDTNIVNKNSENQEIVGKVLMAQKTSGKCVMLIILQASDISYENLSLQDDVQLQINVKPIAYDR